MTTRCCVWVPSLESTDATADVRAQQAMQAVRRLSGEMKVCNRGIDMLGSAARGELTMTVQWRQSSVDATCQLAEKAHDLVSRINAF